MGGGNLKESSEIKSYGHIFWCHCYILTSRMAVYLKCHILKFHYFFWYISDIFKFSTNLAPVVFFNLKKYSTQKIECKGPSQRYFRHWQILRLKDISQKKKHSDIFTLKKSNIAKWMICNLLLLNNSQAFKDDIIRNWIMQPWLQYLSLNA